MTKETFKNLLSAHDWYYQYSDDPAAYRKGMAEAGVIKRDQVPAARC